MCLLLLFHVPAIDHIVSYQPLFCDIQNSLDQWDTILLNRYCPFTMISPIVTIVVAVAGAWYTYTLLLNRNLMSSPLTLMCCYDGKH